MSQDIWADAPADATHYDPIDKNFLRELDRVLLLHHNTQGWGYPHHSQYASKVEDCRQPLILRPAWRGEGVPPAGTVCEYREAKSNPAAWQKVEVAYQSKWSIVLREVDHEDPVDAAYNNPEKLFFRPIRTAEQIAADERSAQILGLADELAGYQDRETGNKHKQLAEYLHDNGYRKQEPTQ